MRDPSTNKICGVLSKRGTGVCASVGQNRWHPMSSLHRCILPLLHSYDLISRLVGCDFFFRYATDPVEQYHSISAITGITGAEPRGNGHAPVYYWFDSER